MMGPSEVRAQMIAIALLVAAAIGTWGMTRLRIVPSWRRIALALAVGLVTAAAATTVSLHACARGQPVSEWLVPVVALTIVLLGDLQRGVRLGLAAGLAMAAVGLSLEYASLVHRDDLNGSRHVRGSSAITVPLWHSLFTGIYKMYAAATPHPDAARVTWDQGFTLAVGGMHLVEIDGERMQVTLEALPSDDRCLLGDRCTGLGTAAVRLRVRTGSGETSLGLTFVSSGAPPLPGVSPCLPVGRAYVRVTDISPWPRHGQRPPMQTYRASFVVSQSCDYVAPAPSVPVAPHGASGGLVHPPAIPRRRETLVQLIQPHHRVCAAARSLKRNTLASAAA